MTEDSWNPLIETTRLILDPSDPSHADELVEVLGDPHLYSFTGGEPPGYEEQLARLERWAQRLSPDGRERWLNWTIRGREDGRALGTLQATIRELDSGGVAEVAWVLASAAQGNGFASEAARALVAFLSSREVTEVEAYIHPAHDASAGVASSIGMEPTDEWSEGERRWRLSH